MKKTFECNIKDIKPGEHFLMGSHEFIGIDVCNAIKSIEHPGEIFALELKELKITDTKFKVIPTVVLLGSNQNVLKLL